MTINRGPHPPTRTALAPREQGQNPPIVCRNWGMEVTPEASTATGMAFASWRMSRGKVYEIHLRIHDHEGLLAPQIGRNCRPGRGKIRLSFAGIGAWMWLLRPPQPRGWLLPLGGCPGARLMSFICGSMAYRACNVGQIPMSTASWRTGKFRSSFAQIRAWKCIMRPPQPWG